MLKHTFCHVPGIGLKTERRLWDNGVLDWDTPLGHVRLKRTSAEAIDALLDASREKLSLGEPAFFSELLPPKESWRIFPDFRDSIAYIDIETNGYMGPHGYITAISLYGLLDEFSDASVHRSLSEVSPVFDDDRYLVVAIHLHHCRVQRRILEHDLTVAPRQCLFERRLAQLGHGAPVRKNNSLAGPQCHDGSSRRV